MGGLERRDDAFGAREEREALERLRVGAGDVFGAPTRREVGVLRADAGVVEACRDRVRSSDLAIRVLQHHRSRPVQDADGSADDRGRVRPGLDAATSRFDAAEPHALIWDEGGEHPDRVRATADARDDDVG